MPKPRFSLAPLLERHRYIEEHCRLRAIACGRARDEVRRMIAKLEEGLRNPVPRDVMHLALLERAIVAQTRALAVQDEEEGHAQEALVAASRDRAVLERLEARQRVEWLRRERRREEREAGW